MSTRSDLTGLKRDADPVRRPISCRGRVLRLIVVLMCLPSTLIAADAGSGADATEDGTSLESALQESIRLQEQIARINEQLADLETRFGPYDPRLLEPLQALTDTLLQLRDFDEAGSILERRLQLLRTSQGTRSLEQIPVIGELIANDLERRDWESVADRFEFIHLLNEQNAGVPPDVVLASRQDLALWNFAQVYLEPPLQRLRHFQDARELLRDNVEAAEELYGENSLELLPWLYQRAVLQYQLVAVVVADDELGVSARDDILLVEGRSSESYLRQGLNLVNRMQEIARYNGDREAEAMAMILDADFQRLLDLGTAARRYREARDMLVEAGLPENEVEDFFRRPVILPVPHFHSRLSAAVAYQDSNGFRVMTGDDGEVELIDLGTFTAWSESLPFARRPDLPAATDWLDEALNYHELELEFSINSRGYTRNPDILDSSTDSARVRRDTRNALRDMQFRPSFEGDRWRRVDTVRLRYQVLPD